MHLAGATTLLRPPSRWTPATALPFMRLSLHGPTTRSGPLAWRPRRTMDNCQRFVNLPPATELCAGLGIDNGSLYITGSTDNWPANALAGDDLKVLIARVTTCSDFSIQACIQVFVGGSQDSVQQACPEETLLVLHQGFARNRMLATTTLLPRRTMGHVCLTMASTGATGVHHRHGRGWHLRPKRVGWMHGCRGMQLRRERHGRRWHVRIRDVRGMRQRQCLQL